MAQDAVLVSICIRRWLVKDGYANLLHRPKEFAKAAYDQDDSEEESTVGKMPPSDSEDE